jgi:Cu(I)/Ag(I) efflux system membrane fusion protein
MKNHQLIFIGMILSVLAGLGLGYLLFHSNETAEAGSPEDTHTHETGTVWTCSMHPQIRNEEPGDCPICGMDLIPLETNASTDPLVLKMTPEAVKLANIQTSIIGSTASSDKTLILSGKIQADERLAASQVAHIPGRIEKLYVTFKGESVRKGQKLATIYSPELVTAQQELLQALELRETNPSLLEAARKKLAYWKIPPAQIQKIEEDREIQEEFDLLADVSGIVTERKVSVGDHLMQGEVLFDVVNLNRLWVLFDAYEEDLANIKIGDVIEFSTPALASEIFVTKISFIDPVINPQTRVASVRGEIFNRKGLLKPEMFVRGILKAQLSREAQLLLPKSAVLWTGQRSVVYLKVPDTAIPSYRYQEVNLGDRVGDNYLIEAGLQAGDEVVTNGSFTIDAAAQLNNQQSMMNQWVNQAPVDEAEEPDYRAVTPEIFQKQLGAFLESYMAFKDALVETSLEKSQKEATPMAKQFKKIDMNLLTGEAHIYWMEKQRVIEEHLTKIQEAENIDEQRRQFSFLSIGLIEAVFAFGIQSEQKVYLQHCPMAMDDQGADWLSFTENILNPYFGDVMLTCGYTKEEITSKISGSD